MGKIEATENAAQRIEYVALSRLTLSQLNVRKKAPTAIDAMAATIEKKGLIQNLVVHEMKGSAKPSKLGVCAGQRRLAALDLLVEQGRITRDYEVPVLIVSEGEAVAASLIENREREAMHLADECVAFRLLTEEGKSVAHIAALFAVPDVAVRRALKIANLSPSLLDLLRDDRLDYEQVKVLALANDHATQERVWGEAVNNWQRRPDELRKAITFAEIDARESALARFVGLDAYEEAGGRVRRDLFSDDANAGYLEDAELLHRLATERLIELTQAVGNEGWQWIETRTQYPAMEILRCGRIGSTTRKPTKAEKAELAALTATNDAAHAALNAYYDEDGEPDEERGERLEAEATAATFAVDQYAERFEAFDPEEMKQAGAYVYLDDDGRVCIERGLVRREEAPTAQAGATHAVSAGAARAPKERPLHGEKLCKRLTAHRTAAVQIELAQQPTVALAVLMQRMIPVVFDDVYGRAYLDCAGIECGRHGRERGLEGTGRRAREVVAHAAQARGRPAALAAGTGRGRAVESLRVLRGGDGGRYQQRRPPARGERDLEHACGGSFALLEADALRVFRTRGERPDCCRCGRKRIAPGGKRSARHEERRRSGGGRASHDGLGLAAGSAA